MSKRMLVARTQEDIGNSYLYAYSELLVQDALDKDWKVDCMNNEKNTRNELESRLEKNKTSFVVLNGHGTDHSIHGHNNAIVLDEGNAPILTGTVVFTRSCSAVNALGKISTEKGCTAFIGYKGKFIIPYIFEQIATPLEDSCAKPVLNASNAVAHSLIKGHTVKEAVNNAKIQAYKWMGKMLSSEEPYNGATFRALLSNDIQLSFEGTAEAICYWRGFLRLLFTGNLSPNRIKNSGVGG